METFKSGRTRLFMALLLAVVVAGGLGIYYSRTTLPTVKINIVTWPGYGPIYLGQAKGFFKDEGVQVDVAIQENTQARTAALISGQIDLMGITFESIVLNNMKGLPMQVVGITDISNGADGIIAKPTITSIADLAGKRVAFPEGQPSQLFLLYQLDKAGVSPSSIIPVYTDDAGKAGELFAAGQVDAAVTWEPWLSTAAKAGKGRILVTSEGVTDILIGILAADRNRVEASKTKLRAFERGWYRSVSYAKDHPAEANPIMAKGLGMPDADFVDALSGLRFISRADAEKYLGVGAPDGEFTKIAIYNAKLWKTGGVDGTLKNPRDTYSPIALEK
jgi:NitT/TauT family transport system substrate-binding protein